MLRMTLLAAAGAALAIAGPALAQDPAENPAVEAALNKDNVMTVRNVARTELTRGLQVFDAGGKPVGTVDRLSGNDVILADGSHEYSVPITEFFAYNQYGKDYFATRQPKAALQAQAATASDKPLAAAH